MTHKQMSLSMQHDAGFERHRKATRRDVFLAEMDQVVPWAALCAVIEPHYPKAPAPRCRWPSHGRSGVDVAHPLLAAVVRALRSGGGRSAVRLGGNAPVRGRRPGARRRAGRNDGVQVPASTGEARRGPSTVRGGGEHLKQHGLKLSQGTIVDATIIAAAPSTKNNAKACDPQMHLTKKGNQWHFGMKAHIRMDQRTSLVHTVVNTAANVAWRFRFMRRQHSGACEASIPDHVRPRFRRL